MAEGTAVGRFGCAGDETVLVERVDGATRRGRARPHPVCEIAEAQWAVEADLDEGDPLRCRHLVFVLGAAGRARQLAEETAELLEDGFRLVRFGAHERMIARRK